ncbi:MFS transporter [Clostridium thermarum]|uniref:MFS transporter n=1 Tax=Clostridium thermarum TaxID=1716543 RepID=UPI0013CFF3F7|nr:MFS transporter [Clostridium thermarum]
MEVSIEKKTGAIRQLMAYKDYRLLLIANYISRFGDSVDSIAYSIMVYYLTGSKLLMGTLFAVNSIPNIVFSPFAGVIADRFDKKKLIIIGYVGRGAIVCIISALYFFNLLEPWHLFMFTVMTSTLETLTSPVFMSLTPMLLPKSMYLTANSFSTSAYRFAELVGLAVTPVIISLIGISAAILIDGVTFFLAVFIILFMKVDTLDKTKEAINIKAYLTDIKEGFLFIKSSYLIRNVALLFAIINFCLAPINVLMPALVSEVLKGDASVLSALSIVLVLGMIIGGLVVGQIGNRYRKHSMMSLGIILFGLSYFLLYLPGNLIPQGIYSTALATFVFFAFGFMIPFINSPIMTYVMSNTDKSMLGRIGALIAMITCCSTPLGAAITGAITETLPMTTIFAIMGGIITLLGIRVLFNRRIKDAV